MQDTDLVVVTEVDSALDAQLYREALGDAGIPVMLQPYPDDWAHRAWISTVSSRNRLLVYRKHLVAAICIVDDLRARIAAGALMLEDGGRPQ